jgi:hypothetical protein
MKTLHVHSNGQWVEVGGSGAADLSQYATIEYVDGKVPAAASVTEHDAELPQVSPGSTPLQILQAWAGYEPGLHLFKGGPQRNMVLLSKASMTGTTNTAQGEKPTASESLTATVFINGTGSTYIRIVTTTVDGVQANANSEIVATMGGQWAKMTSTKGDVPFGASQVTDLFSLTGGGPQDLTGYALKDDDTQVISAAVVRALRHEFNTNAALAWEDVGGTARPVYKSGSKTFPLAFTTEVGGGSVDLSPYAKLQDNQQALLSKTITAQAYGFGDTILPAVGLGYVDTGEGYGNRLVLNIGLENEFLVYKSDLEPLNALLPRLESLEGKSAPAVDLSGYAKTVEVATTLMVYAKTADVAAFVEANYTPKDTTYTKTEADGKFLTLVDVNGVYAFAAETYKKTETYTKAEVETRLLEVPSPMKYLQWGGAFQKMLAGNAKDKWFSAGLIPSIQIVKGKHYRLEMTTKFGPLNADYKECWVGFRFNYKALNELPCTKQPLVTMGGFGHTTVTNARAAIAATAVATTTPTRADRFRFLAVDDWASAEDIIDYAVEFEADRDIASANFVPEICFGGTWGQYPTNFEGVVAVFRQMD